MRASGRLPPDRRLPPGLDGYDGLLRQAPPGGPGMYW
jgi:hypothetical protein